MCDMTTQKMRILMSMMTMTQLIRQLSSLDTDSGNLAKGRPTFASSTHSDETTSSWAVDGVFYESGHAYENCFASEYEESPWWMLQMDRPYVITYVYVKTCGRLEHISGYVGNTTESLMLCDYNDELWEPFQSMVLGCETPILGELFKIYAGKDRGDGKHIVLSLSEVSVQTVDHADALSKAQAFSSSVHAGMDPRFAIDGIDIRTSSISICFISMSGYSPWWAVELDKHYEIDSIIFQSNKQIGKVSVFVGNTKETPFLCTYLTGPTMSVELVKLLCDRPILGRYVKIVQNFYNKNKTEIIGVLNLCEVEVYARVINVPTFNKSCGSVLTETTGWLASPDSDNDGLYDNNEDCWWFIIADFYQAITINITDIDIEDNPICGYDYVKVFDGFMDSMGELGTFCGSIVPPVLTSIYKVVYVRFKTDDSWAYSGFNATYTTNYVFQCGEVFHYTTRRFNYTSVQTGATPLTDNCTWVILAEKMEFIDLSLLYINLPNSYLCELGSVKVYDGIIADYALMESYCGQQSQVTLQSTASVLFIRLTIHDSFDDIEFIASYYKHCGAVHTGARVLDFELINHDNSDIYDNNLNCTWKIVVNTYEKIVLDIMSIDIEDAPQCQNDYLKVYNDVLDSTGLLGTYCGSSPPSSIFTGSNVAYLRFISDDTVTGAGFKARYQTQCELILTDTSGSFTSIDSDQDGYSDSYQNCTWIISGGDYKVVRLEITELDIHLVNTDLCSRSNINDVFQIFEGWMDERLHHDEMCSLDSLSFNFTFTSVFSDVYVQFISRSSDERRGFKANYFLEEGDYTKLLQGQSGWIQSFDYDNNGLYDPNLRCRWIILHRSHTVLLLNIHEMDIEDHATCDFDFLRVSWRRHMYSEQVDFQKGTFCGREAPPLIDLNIANSILIIYFHSDGSISGQGFNATYHHIESSDLEEIVCGSAENDTSGWIGFFRDITILNNDAYSCLWTITAKESYSVMLRLLTLNIDWSPGCEDNYLTAHDGSLSNDRQIDVFCGAQIANMLSVSNVMHVRIFIQSAGKNRGFLVAYSQVVQGYDYQTIFPDPSNTREVLSPIDTDGEGRYDHKQDILWRLYARVNRVLTIYITYMDIQWGENCEFDSLQVFNETARQGIFCGTNLPNTHMSPSSGIFIHFHSDLSVNGGGFNVTYIEKYVICLYISPEYATRISEKKSMDLEVKWQTICKEVIEECSTDLLLTGPSAMFTSLDSDNDGFYDANLDCVWTIEATETQIVKLQIDSMDIQGDDDCSFDLLEVFELIMHGFSGRFCGNVPPPIIRTVSSHLNVRFSSDEVISGRGFNATFWKEDLICGGILNESSGEIRAMDRNNDGLYDNNLECHWSIVCGPNQLVELKIVSIDLEKDIVCAFDYIEVFVNGTSLGKRCQMSSTESKLVSLIGFDIHFRSDAYVNAAGFVAVYSISDIRNNCSTTLNATKTQNMISSPDSNDDGLYDNNVNCSWSIVALEGMSVELQITVKDIECEFDHLEVFSSSFCGLNVQFIIVSPTNVVEVNFFADASVSGRGFDITYKAISNECSDSCDFTANWLSGRITSLDCDQDGFYDYNLWCTWTIIGEFYLDVKIQIDALDIQETENCICDYVQVYDGLVEDNTVIGTYCGTYTPRVTHTSSRNQLTLLFVSDYTIVGTGFNATYEIEFNYECGAILAEGTGTFRAPDLDNSGQYDARLRCYWVIPSTPDHKTYLRFRWMDIEWHELCTFDYVEVNEKTIEGTLLLGTYCGTTAPPVFVSQNIFIILFVSDISNSGRGFHAGFYKLEGSVTPTQSQSVMTSTSTQFITTTSRGAPTVYQTSPYSHGKTDHQLSKETTESKPSNTTNKTTRYTDHTPKITTNDQSHRTDTQQPLTDALTQITVISYSDVTENNASHITQRTLTETLTTNNTLTTTLKKTSQTMSTVQHQVSSRERDMTTSDASIKVSERSAPTTPTSTSSGGVKCCISLISVTIVLWTAYLSN